MLKTILKPVIKGYLIHFFVGEADKKVEKPHNLSVILMGIIGDKFNLTLINQIILVCVEVVNFLNKFG